MESLPIRRPSLSDYERRALAEIQAWRNPEPPGWLGRTLGSVTRGLYDAAGLVRYVPGVEWVVENVVGGVLRLTNEIVHDSVWTDAIRQEYCRAGHEVERREDIRRLDLEQVDACLEGLDTKYRAMAAAEGAATGYAGLPGIVPDVVALAALNLRAAGEYAAYCGFDVAEPAERLYALQLLDAVSRAGDATRQVAYAPLVRVSTGLARRQAADTVSQLAVSRAIRQAVESLGLHLARAKLAQVVPVTGAVVGSGYNAYYTSRVCDAAFHLYRERFLLHKYGPLPAAG